VINYDINTAGHGFVNDAVIATIGVEEDPTIECLDDLLDIKVANYPVSGAYESSHAKQFSSFRTSPEHTTEAPARHETADSELKEETADQPYCDPRRGRNSKRRPFLGLHPGFAVPPRVPANWNSSADMRNRSG
jgi:hypothetical protein